MLLLFGAKTADFTVLDLRLRSLLGGSLVTNLLACLVAYTIGNIIIGPFAALEGQLATRRRDKDAPCFLLASCKPSQINILPSLSHIRVDDLWTNE